MDLLVFEQPGEEPCNGAAILILATGRSLRIAPSGRVEEVAQGIAFVVVKSGGEGFDPFGEIFNFGAAKWFLHGPLLFAALSTILARRFSVDGDEMSKASVVLLSGGIDSAVCLALARNRCNACIAVTVDYGQRNRAELASAGSLAAWAEAKHIIVPLDFAAWNGHAQKDTGSYIPARNLVFLSLAVSVAEAADANSIYIGATSSDRHFPDARPEFIRSFQATVGLGTKAPEKGQSIEVRTPLLPLSKVEVIKAAARLGVPLALTRSCYEANEPCGACGACRTRAEAFTKAGIADPLLV